MKSLHTQYEMVHNVKFQNTLSHNAPPLFEFLSCAQNCRKLLDESNWQFTCPGKLGKLSLYVNISHCTTTCVCVCMYSMTSHRSHSTRWAVICCKVAQMPLVTCTII